MSSNIFGVFLTVAALPLVTLLMIIYYAKNKFDNARTKIFKIMLWTLLIGCFFEILKAISITNSAPRLILEIISRVDFIFETIWWYVLQMYTFISYQNETIIDLKSAIKYNKFTKGLTLYYIVLLLLILFVPSLSTVENVDANKIIYMPTKVIIISIFVIGIEFIESIYFILKTKNDSYHSDDRLVSYTITISIIIYYIVQSSFQYISFPMIFFTLFYYLAYYLNENPDLKLLKATNISRDNIEKSNKSKTYLLSNISNGVKEPIDLMIGLCDEINNSVSYDEAIVKRNVNEILKAGNKLIGVINNVLDVSILENDKVVVTEAQYNSVDLISSLIEFANKRIESKPIKMIVNVDNNISSKLCGDFAKLNQSLFNILENAIKYTDVGRITIEVTSNKSDSIEHLLFKISDTGIGIAEENQENIFSENNNSDNISSGLGISLKITKQYIESMGGKIWFKSEYGVGSSFFVDIDQKIIDSKPIGNIDYLNNNSKAGIVDCSKYKALIVDDSILNINVTIKLLKKYNFQIDYITDSEECVRRIKNFEKFDIIFIDHIMPKINGIELMHILKFLDGYEIPPLVALTANAILGVREMYIKEGFDEYLAKPIDHNDLEKIINKYFKDIKDT